MHSRTHTDTWDLPTNCMVYISYVVSGGGILHVYMTIETIKDFFVTTGPPATGAPRNFPG